MSSGVIDGHKERITNRNVNTREGCRSSYLKVFFLQCEWEEKLPVNPEEN